MADTGMRGTNALQDSRFKDKELASIKSTKFPKHFSEKVDLRKVNISVLRPWVAEKVTELIKVEDDIVVEYVFGMLEDRDNPTPDPKKMQVSLVGFMDKYGAAAFMDALWKLLLSAQKTVGGVPAEFIEAKKQELQRKQQESSSLPLPPLPPSSASHSQARSSAGPVGRSRAEDYYGREPRGGVNRLEIDHETMDGLPAAAVVVLPPTLGKGITVARPHLTVLPHHPLLRAKREVEARAGVDPSRVLLLRPVVPVHVRVPDLDPSHARCLLVHVHVPLRLPLFVCAVPTDTNTDVGHLVVVGARAEAVVEVEVEAGVGEGVIPHHVRKLENTHDPCPDREHGPAHDLDLEHLSDDGRGITLPHLNFKGMTRVRGG
ncbi:serine/arginine repetitive matrix protein 1, partial [Cryptococcus deuterogattii 99/473]